MNTQKRQILTSWIYAISILYFSYLMISITLPYTSWEWDVDFLKTKYKIIHLSYYRLSFYIHIFTSSIILLSGAILFSNYILKKYKNLHSWIGKVYVGLLLLFAAPSGLVMAFHANGGSAAKISFIILTLCWWSFTYLGYSCARSKKFNEHKKWMIRSYALTLSAISLRVSQMLLSYYFNMDPRIQYILISWTSWVGNLLIAECIILYQINKKSNVLQCVLQTIKSSYQKLSFQ